MVLSSLFLLYFSLADNFTYFCVLAKCVCHLRGGLSQSTTNLHSENERTPTKWLALFLPFRAILTTKSSDELCVCVCLCTLNRSHRTSVLASQLSQETFASHTEATCHLQCAPLKIELQVKPQRLQITHIHHHQASCFRHRYCCCCCRCCSRTI